VSNGRRKQGPARGVAPKGPQKPQDARVVYTNVDGDQNISGLDLEDGALVILQGDVDLPDSRHMLYPAPNIAGFNLIEAHKHQLRARKLREELLRGLREIGKGHYQTSDAHRVFDFLSAATSAVLMSFLAIEGVVNALIDRLPADAEVTVKRRKNPVTYPKTGMHRGLSVGEKIDLAAPLSTGRESIKGTTTWEKFDSSGACGMILSTSNRRMNLGVGWTLAFDPWRRGGCGA
jgi:hypothetical protein